MATTDIYTQFTPGDIVSNQEETITRALFSNNVGNLTTFYTSSDQTAQQKRYYYEVFNSSSDSPTAEAQFSIAFGHRYGSGSADDGGQVEDGPTRAIYSQYKQLCLDPGEDSFTVGGQTANFIYVVNINTARMRDFVDEGNLELNVHHLSGSEFITGGGTNATHTGSNVTLSPSNSVLRLIDDSRVSAATVTTAGEVYNIVSGSLEDGVYNTSSPLYFGKLYKNLGIIVLGGEKLDQTASFGTVTGSEVAGDNAFKMFTAMSGAALRTDVSGDYLGFQARSAEKVKSTYFFVRASNSRYNFSNNPTFVTGSDGDLAEPTFINNPRTYITTVGLYNNNKELLAVAKLSKPLQKSFVREASIKVKLDF